jgi:hypothetical protein
MQAQLVMATCNAQGDLLQPERPLLSIDAKFASSLARAGTADRWRCAEAPAHDVPRRLLRQCRRLGMSGLRFPT